MSFVEWILHPLASQFFGAPVGQMVEKATILRKCPYCADDDA